MAILRVDNLCKSYEKFQLLDVSFSLDEGYIMGFIGANGAGKTTTIKSLLNIARPDSGEVEILGRNIGRDELFCKQNVGLILGGFDFYKQKKLKTITGVVRRFYPGWDDTLYESYLDRFSLDPEKKVGQLSSGMRVKYALALSLSHNARLLILDEPTSGLDPVSRDEILEIFQSIIEDGTRSILFSTHITSDLEKCADFITYIKDGQIVKSADKDSFLSDYMLVMGDAEKLCAGQARLLIGRRDTPFGFTGLIYSRDAGEFSDFKLAAANLDSVMIYHEKEANGYERAAI